MIQNNFLDLCMFKCGKWPFAKFIYFAGCYCACGGGGPHVVPFLA